MFKNSYVGLMIITLFFNCYSFDRITDSLALVAIKTENQGSAINWNFAESLDKWEGIGLSNNRVTSLDMNIKDVTSLPKEIGDLTNLEQLLLEDNTLTTIPTEIGNLTNLYYLSLTGNDIVSLPSEIEDLTSLEILILAYNSLTSLPDEIVNISSLRILNVISNNLTSLPANMVNLSALTSITVFDNELQFGDIEYLVSEFPGIIGFNMGYSQQDSVPTYLSYDQTNLYVSVSGTNNGYQWYKNGSILVGQTSDILNIDITKAAEYYCIASNSVITDLEIPSLNYVVTGGLAPTVETNFRTDQFFSSFQNRSISITLPQQENISISLFDMRGRMVQTPVTRHLPTGTHSFAIGNELSQGFYVLSIVGNTHRISTKIFVQ